MKSRPYRVAISLLVVFFCAATVSLHAGTVENIKAESKKAARKIKEGAVETGKSAVETGKEIKEGSKKAWKDAKEGAKEVGRDFKKAYEKTRDAVRKKLSENDSPTEKTNKTDE